MRATVRILVLVVALAGIVLGVPRLPEIPAFALFILCTALIATAIAPFIARFSANTLVDLIFSTHGSRLSTEDVDNQQLYAQSQNVFSILRTISFLVLAAGLYGFHWSVPILCQWPKIDDLAPMPPRLIAALGVAIVSGAVWLFYLGVYFIPALYRTVRDAWWEWRFR